MQAVALKYSLLKGKLINRFNKNFVNKLYSDKLQFAFDCAERLKLRHLSDPITSVSAYRLQKHWKENLNDEKKKLLLKTDDVIKNFSDRVEDF